MSRIPIDLPPDAYPERRRRSRGGIGGLALLVIFASFFVLTYLAMEIF